MKGFKSSNVINFSYGGSLGTTTDLVESVKDSINTILSTKVGERPGMPDYGTRLSTAVFEVNDPLTVLIIQDEIYDAIERYEPRAIIKSVNVQSDVDGYITNVDIDFDIRDLRLDIMKDKIK